MKKRKLATLTLLSVSAAGIIHTINRTIEASALLKNVLETSHTNYYDWRFGKVYYRKTGEGTPLLLIHDLVPGASAYEWYKVEKELAVSHTVYSIDLLGCGRSDKPGFTYTNFLYVQLINDFIKNVIKVKTDVITSGYSGSFAVMASYNHNDYIGRLILINPPSLNSLNQAPNKRQKFLKTAIEIPVFGTLIYNMVICRENITDSIMENYFYNPFHVESEMIDAYYEAAHKNTFTAKCLYASIVGKYTNISITRALKNLDNPVIVLYGEHEKNGEEIADSYISCNSAFTSSVINRTKHLPHMEDPQAFLKTIYFYIDQDSQQ